MYIHKGHLVSISKQRKSHAVFIIATQEKCVSDKTVKYIAFILQNSNVYEMFIKKIIRKIAQKTLYILIK